ncbi:MAG TPA: hypothetical protein DCZ94_21420 [Lentisphaeria bacterium]|nr:MAG: hypothetical protein A2X48_22545 [Lentisphaerae bacterium GWF2_49_21]HBC89505.1 hypothetical protein [Lentisphaeria bacterium]
MKSFKELAKELGISNTVVSNVYHDKWRQNHISEALAKRVKKALELSGTRPSQAGIQLRTGKSMMVGVLLPDFGMSYWMNIMKGIEGIMTPYNYLMILANTKLGLMEREAFSSVVSRGVDGIILTPYSSALKFNRMMKTLGKKIPLVFVDSSLAGVSIDYVVSNNRRGSFELVKRMFSAGRKRVAYLGIASEVSATEERFCGYLDALELFNKPFDELLVQRADIGNDRSAETLDKCLSKALGNLLSLKSPPDAIFIESLLHFKNGFEMLAARKIKVPEEILIAGFDNFAINWLSNSNIDPNSILRAEQDGEAIGKFAASRLKELISMESAEAGNSRLELHVEPKIIIPQSPD